MEFYDSDKYTLSEVTDLCPDALEIVPVTGGWQVFTDARDLEIWESQI